MPAGVAEFETTGTQQIDINTCEPQAGVLWAIELREEVTQGGIVLPDTGEAQALRIGVCVQCGAGEPDGQGGEKHRFIKRGDFFMFGKYQSGGEPFTINGVRLLLFRQGDVAGKVRNPDRWMLDAAARRMAKLYGG